MSQLHTILSTILVFILGFFGLYALFNWYQNRRAYKTVRNYGFAMGGVLLALEFLTIIALSIEGIDFSLGGIIWVDFIAFFRIAALTIVGIQACITLDIPSVPLIANYLIYSPPNTTEEEVRSSSTSNEPSIASASDLSKEAHSDFDEDLLPKIDSIDDEAELAGDKLVTVNLRGALFAALGIAFGGVLYSAALFLITDPRASEFIQGPVGNEESSSLFLSLMVGISFAFAEEITFRLGIQNILAANLGWFNDRYNWAIWVSATLWTIAHVGVLEPNWVKMVQIFPMGLLLGWLFKKYGVESCIIAHVLFNIILVLIGDWLIIS